MKFNNKETFRRYLTRLIKEEKDLMEDEFDSYLLEDGDDWDDMEDSAEEDFRQKSVMKKNDYAGYGGGSRMRADMEDLDIEDDYQGEDLGGDGWDEEDDFSDARVREEAYIPRNVFTSSINESRVNKETVKVKKAFNMLKEGKINRKRFYNVVEKITGCQTRDTYVTTNSGNVSLRRFIRSL